MRATRAWAGLCLLLALGCAWRPGAGPVFRITLVDASTGRGVPAVELRTVDARSFVSDSAGVVAIGDPALLDQAVFFHVRSFGYRFEDEVHGWPGVTLDVAPGGAAVLELQRENVAERLYRITGPGVYRDSLLAGAPVPFEPVEPPPAGSDSALAHLYRGELFWIWGDTSLLSAPLGIFRTTGATSLLPGRGGLDPEVGIALRYFRSDGALRAMVDDAHPVIWLSALRATQDASGRERLFASYRKVAGKLRTVERGLVELDEAKGTFRVASAYPASAPFFPDGHALRYREGDTVYLQTDIDVRSRDDAESVLDLASYEVFTAAKPGARFGRGADALERDASGRLVWAWKRNARPLTLAAWKKLEKRGAVAPHEWRNRMLDVETGETIVPHHGSLQWNAYRRRWILIRSQLGGKSSYLGEVYYFEADTPRGPWPFGRKVVTHAREVVTPDASPARETYTFYNPVHHPELDRDGGRVIFFEGTLSTLFAEPAAEALPGYDYNQMMYKLSLDDPRLFLPVAVYRVGSDPPRYRTLEGLGDAAALPGEAAFFAPDRPRAGTVPVRELAGAGGRLALGGAESAEPARFYCAPGGEPPPATVPLYEQVGADGIVTYSTAAPSGPASVLCHVWPAPG